jgi:hypothetical protein
MRNKVFVLLVLLALVVSCRDSHQTGFLHLFKSEISIKHSILGVNPNDIPSPYSISVIDTFLVLDNLTPSNIGSSFYVYSIKSKKKTYEYLAIGGGPCEVPGMLGNWTTRRPHGIEFDSPNQQVIKTFKIGQQFTTNNCNFDTTLCYGYINQRLTSISQLNDSIFITSGFFSDGRIGILNSRTQLFKTYFNYPDSNEVKLDNIAPKAMVFQGRYTCHPNGMRFAWTNVGDIFEIFDYKDGEITRVKSYYGNMPKYRSGDGGYLFLREHNRGFISDSKTGKYIYLLYSTKTLGERIYTADCLLVFDWNGNPIRRYTLDVPIRGIFTNDDKTLYAIAEIGDDTQVVTFNMNHGE